MFDLLCLSSAIHIENQALRFWAYHMTSKKYLLINSALCNWVCRTRLLRSFSTIEAIWLYTGSKNLLCFGDEGDYSENFEVVFLYTMFVWRCQIERHFESTQNFGQCVFKRVKEAGIRQIDVPILNISQRATKIWVTLWVWKRRPGLYSHILGMRFR